MIQIHRVPTPPARDAEPHPVVHALADVEAEVLRDLVGHDDFSESARARTARLFGSDYADQPHWVALADGADPETCAPADVLGFASMILMRKQDLQTAQVWVGVRPSARSRGIGRALFEAALAEGIAHGRTVWQAYADSPDATGRPDAIVPTSGAGAVDPDRPASRWLVADGWTLELCETPSRLDLTADLLQRAASALEEGAGSDGYVLASWGDSTPPEHREGVCRVMERMSTDPPAGGMEYDPSVWTPERLVDSEHRQVVAGQRSVVTVALHAGTGEVAAYTHLAWPEENPAGVWQEETLVLPHHRGHGLGMWTKLANLARLVEANPEARRVHTWNAVENRPMLAINDALGFVPVGVEGCWQKRL